MLLDKIEIGFRILCGFGVLFVVWKRVVTVFYLSIRYCEDGSSVMHRTEFPHWYVGRRKTFIDRIRFLSYKLFPDSRDYSDYKGTVWTYQLWESDRIHMYLRKTFLSTVLSLSFFSSGILGVLKDHILIILISYFSFMVVFSWTHYISMRYHSPNIILRRRIRFLRLTPMDLIYRWSLGIFRITRKLRLSTVLYLNVVFILFIFAVLKIGGIST